MPNSPKVDFNIVNNNVEVTTPQKGVSNVVARTTKGKPFYPDTVISSLSQFKQLFGEEIVAPGKISNIETALKLGSKLRVSRVLGENYALGSGVLATNTAGTLSANGTTIWPNGCIILSNAVGSDKEFIGLKLVSKEYGTPLKPAVTTAYAKVTMAKVAGINMVYLNIYSTATVASMGASTLIGTYLIAKYKQGVGGFVDTKTIKEFNNNSECPYVLDFAFASIDLQDNESPIGSISTLDKAIEVMTEWAGTVNLVDDASSSLTTVDGTALYYIKLTVGSEGDTILDTDWALGYEATKNYVDAYNLAFLGIYDSIDEADALSLMASVREELDAANEMRLFVEVPIYDSEGNAMEHTDIISWVESAIDTIGNSKYVSYFAGGWKYRNRYGNLVDGDNLGTILGLSDTSATAYGPWYQFSGKKRGVAYASAGPVSPNYGSPMNYNKLNLIAQAMINMSVVKEIPGYGLKAMLAHNFTTHIKTDSFRFMGVVGLCLYIKKNLRPIMEGYLEEPNTFSTWVNMYYEAKKVFDELLSKEAITEYAYAGDQDATSYAQLQVNNEADVRQGKYKVRITFKEVIGLQELSVDLILDAVGKTVSVNIN